MRRLTRMSPRIAALDTRRLKPQQKRADPFYLSPEWRRLVAEIVAERGRICEDPECPRPHPPISRVFGDHVVELRDGGAPLDKANVMLRCGAAHTRVTARRRALRLGAPAGGWGGG